MSLVPDQQRWLRAHFVAWSVLMLAVLAVFGVRVLPQLRVETDILALLPQQRHDAALDQALDVFSAKLARRQIFLVGAPTLADAKLAASAFASELRGSNAFESVELELNADLRERAAVYLAHSAYLLSPQDQEALATGRGDVLLQRALRAAYTPAGLMQPLSLAQDPLGLMNNFLRTQMPAAGAARLDGTMLVVEAGASTYVLILSENRGSPFSSAVQERVVPAIERAGEAARKAVQVPVEILSSGAIQHAAAATQRATHEITTFGTIETIAVIVLLWAVFGSMRPLVLGIMTLSLAILAAFTVVHVTFGHVHVLALVFGSSLIGSVIDYTIHFFADRFRDPARWTPVEAVRHVGPAVLLGLTTTLSAFAVLAMIPFPGLKQIALFCMTGLAVGCGCVLCLYPTLAVSGRALPQLGFRIGVAVDDFMRGWRWTGPRLGVLAMMVLLVGIGIARIRLQDDVKALQQSPPGLIQSEQRVRELLGSGIETRFFLVTGDSEQAVLENEQRLTQKLDELVRDGAIASYRAVSNAVPSLEQQQRNRELLGQKVYASGGLLEQVMSTLGFATEAIARRREAFASSSSPLSVGEWLQSPAALSAGHLWLGAVGDRYASVVTLGGIANVGALDSIAMPGVSLIDRVAQTTQVLEHYRRGMTALLVVICAVACLVLGIRFGWRDALRMLLPSVSAMLVTVGLFGWLGVPFNLFTLLAFWLVLGLGIDYGIFLRHGRDHRPTAILSVTLSACTTLIAFGLLALSATPFIRSIGLALLFAIALSWVLVLFSCLTTMPRLARGEEVVHG